MSFTRIDHVTILAPDLDKARDIYCNGFGMSVDQSRTPISKINPGSLPDVNSLLMPIAEMCVEFATPITQKGEAHEFIQEKSSGGIHHLCLNSDNLTEDIKHLESKGIKIRADQLEGWNGKTPVLLDPNTTFGLQLMVCSSEDYYPHPAYRGNGNFNGMAHIGIAARSYEEQKFLWEECFKLPQDYTRDRGGPREKNPDGTPRLGPDDPVYLKEFPIGSCVIEISIPADEDSGTAKFVAQRALQGAAFHHIGPWSPNVHKVIDQAKEYGIQQIGAVPEPGLDINYVAWFHPKTCIGTLVEVWNRAEPH